MSLSFPKKSSTTIKMDTPSAITSAMDLSWYSRRTLHYLAPCTWDLIFS